MVTMEREPQGWYLATQDVWNWIGDRPNVMEDMIGYMESTRNCVCTTELYCYDALARHMSLDIWNHLGSETPSLYGMDNVRWDNLAEWFIAYHTGREPKDWSLDL
jgi:hypothetical protein